VKTRRALSRCARGIAFVAALAGLHPACAERMGKKAAAGAVAELQRQSSDDPSKQAARVAATRAVEGAVETLDEPAQRARIDHMVSQAAAAAATVAVQNATRQLVAELGADGEGPLAVSIARTGERVSAAAVSSVGSEIAALAPECAGPDPLGCIERRLQQTARSAASSFTTGVKETIGWQLLLVAFGLGAGGGVLGAWLWSWRDLRRRSLRTA
jgi:hypothetical protein